jgi:hypothetical protein
MSSEIFNRIKVFAVRQGSITGAEVKRGIQVLSMCIDQLRFDDNFVIRVHMAKNGKKGDWKIE